MGLEEKEIPVSKAMEDGAIKQEKKWRPDYYRVRSSCPLFPGNGEDGTQGEVPLLGMLPG